MGVLKEGLPDSVTFQTNYPRESGLFPTACLCKCWFTEHVQSHVVFFVVDIPTEVSCGIQISAINGFTTDTILYFCNQEKWRYYYDAISDVQL